MADQIRSAGNMSGRVNLDTAAFLNTERFIQLLYLSIYAHIITIFDDFHLGLKAGGSSAMLQTGGGHGRAVN